MKDETPAALLNQRLAKIEDRLDKGADNMRSMRDELANNTAITADVRELMEAGRSGFRMLGWLGTGAKWIGVIAAAATAIWVLFYQATHNGQLPK